MKKLLVFYLFAAMLLIAIYPAMAQQTLPGEIQMNLSQWEVISSACWEETATWFVMTRTPEEGNVLHCFVNESGVWTEAFRTDKAVPQEDKPLKLHISEGAWSFRNTEKGEYLQGPILIILQHGMDGSVERMINFQRSEEGIWNLIAFRSYTENVVINVNEKELSYYAPLDKGQSILAGTIPCTIERDLRTFCINDIPLTYPQPQQEGSD